MPAPAARLAELLAPARRVLVFTGAGLSTGSGIPDFRGPNGAWTRRQPVYHQEFLASEAKRCEYWDGKAEAWDAFAAARPNAAHEAIVALERAGRVRAVVTQNIDGLHQAAGSRDVVEVHGTNREVECLSCGARTPPGPHVERFRERRACPTCAACGGLLKFATISFGQALRPEVLDRAVRAAEGADLALSLGSTLSVHPAASIPLIAARHGAPHVIVNRGATEMDAIATLKLDEDVARVLPEAVDEVLGDRSAGA